MRAARSLIHRDARVVGQVLTRIARAMRSLDSVVRPCKAGKFE
jgi:hypothetical protein